MFTPGSSDVDFVVNLRVQLHHFISVKKVVLLPSKFPTVIRGIYFIISRTAVCFVAVFMCFAASAQLCNGSLGDPVVNITFGSGVGPGAALSAATTSYRYTTDACPLNGFYSILNRGVECNYGWHVLPGDHTGNTNGYFMLVDASLEPGVFYLDTVKNLCANTTYEFAAWMLNLKYVTQGTRPDITFNIETPAGQVLKTYNSGDIPVEQAINWKQYGFYFTTPLNVSAILLRMTNNAPGGDGNDLALDDITFRPCGQLITATVQGLTNDTINVCDDNSHLYTFTAAVASGYILPVYQWQLSTSTGTGWNDIAGENSILFNRQPTAAGNFWYRFAVVEAGAGAAATCRIASNTIIVNVHPKPLVDAGADRMLVAGNSITLMGKVEGENITYAWEPQNFIDNIHTLTPSVSPAQDISYQLTASSAFGCTNSDQIQVKVVSGLYIPSAFTPNADGKNDTWKIPFLDPAYHYTVQVFNRFGQRVYEATDEVVEWDGKFNGLQQPAGSYVYVVIFKTSTLKLRGTVTIIR